MITRLHDAAQIYNHLRKNTSLFAYHIGDLDPFFFPNCTWYGLIENHTLVEVVLVYHGLSTPTVLALSITPAMPQLIDAIIDELPSRFFCHYMKELEPVFTSAYTMTPLGTHFKMDFHENRANRLFNEPRNCIQLTTHDEAQLRQLYHVAYPGNYFHSRMLATGKYYGIKQGDDILSVAGVHVFSPAYRIAVLGNITTHPVMRNRGLATQCVSTLVKVLLPDVDFIGLNVHADNAPAIALYQRIGFTIASTYEEAMFEKHYHTTDKSI